MNKNPLILLAELVEAGLMRPMRGQNVGNFKPGGIK